MNSQGTGEKNNDERTIRQETNETKTAKESTNPVTIFQQKPNSQKNNNERTIRQETNETKKNKNVLTHDGLSAKAKSALTPPTLVGEIRLCAC